MHDVSRETPAATPDLAAARSWYEKAADLGHVFAQFALANMFHTGEGAPRDADRARHWFELAAQGGFAEAQMHYAKMLQTGVGGRQSLDDAAFWYRKAVDQGHELAATNLALMHYQKKLSNASDNESFRLFGLAAGKLDGLAHLMLGEMRLTGRGTEAHGGYALLHYCIACLLLPPGSNRDRAESQKQIILDQNPDMREKFEADAAAYVTAQMMRNAV